MRLYETHLPVATIEIAEHFYRTIVGLPFAYRDPTRDIIFLWAGSKEQGMIGLWGPGTVMGRKPALHENATSLLRSPSINCSRPSKN
jgi:hypothetical protein